MYGWRTRLGAVVPSSNTTVEGEFTTYAPEGVSVHAARMPLESVTPDELDAMADAAVDCADRLSHADVDVVAYACTTGSLLHGPGFDRELELSLAEAAGVPAVATALSVKRALHVLGAERLGVVTPYTEELNQRETDYLESAGYDVITLDGLGIESNTEIGEQTPENAYRQTRMCLDTAPEVDAVFVSCTNYRTLPMIERLERDCDVPVVTSNGATLWDALQRADVSTADIPGRFTSARHGGLV
ncbi:maleate cis-trans isomerase [Halogeometricum borinquense DSM 11551]|uniref:Maleate cis-trans isomerase n=1 Tax=Halogeometricum borinquense (strain ATCC 700274 / DSM 11551 / JCM 10706 / KCTC 4070 / PR3) TaxID=469382 RepID=E4NUQ2_HALBP|nr:aspartate/glutamate racemase family protein [Halogeometricum borinquense]ADQ68772.1 maleate cis-trans isomerase [Halogeometricum borinquense DSM 11551]ELY25665.1 maleate cis-trans isomerase [Halogeometricum borinquense DSM 11551]